MDFKRIQWIFLLIFVAIDFFLGLQWYQGIKIDTVESVGLTSVLKEMQSDNINFKKPSNNVGEGFYIASNDSYEYNNHTNQLKDMIYSYNNQNRQLTVQFSEKIKFKIDVEKPKKELDKFIDNPENVIYGKDYSYALQLTRLSKRQIIYVQSFPAGLVFDNTGEIKFKIDDDGYVVGYTQTHVSEPKILREKTPTISEEKALTWLYQYNEIPNNAAVVWTKLAYSKLLNIDNTTVYVPTWFFGVRNANSENIRVKKINAFTGTMVKDTIKN